MKYSEIERKLINAGCYFYKRGGNHEIWFSPITEKKFSLSYHKSEEAPIGTIKSISNDSGVKI
jgi:predicted RNA binding protein YcfA (HicA-like mRNA interferase family)